MFILQKVCIIYVRLELLEKATMRGLNFFFQPAILRNKRRFFFLSFTGVENCYL
jgi:hypothetical protein